jgi:predicted Zn-dependent protease
VRAPRERPQPGGHLKRPLEKPRKWNAAAARAREELLRPCPYLGYDHDHVGVHCLAKGAVAIAEKSFRRAIWLNPYEPRFVVHLAHALVRQNRWNEALQALDGIDPQWEDFENVTDLRRTILSFVRGTTVGEKR